MGNRIKEHYKDFISLLALGAAFYIFQIWDIYSAYYSAIGDEYAFYLYGKNVATGQYANVFSQLFSQDGVYGIIPVASGIYQGLVMKIIGINVLGWKSAQILVIIASIFPLYYLVRRLWNKLTAYTTVFLFLLSHYIWAYIKTGYCNLEAIFPTVWSLYFFDRALYLKSRMYAILTGLMAGLGFMTFYSSRITIGIVFCAGLIATIRQRSFFLIAWILIGFSLIYIPFILFNGDRVYKAMFDESFISSNEHRSISRIEMIPQNAYMNARAFIYNTHEGPYVSGSLVDPLTGVLAIVGLLIVVFGITQYRNYFVILWLMLGFLTTGIFSKFSYPAISRLNYLIPVIALLGGITISTVSSRLRGPYRYLGITFLMLAILALNLYRFYITTPSRNLVSRESAAILAYQHTCSDKKTLIIDRDPGPVLLHVIDAYHLPNIHLYRIAAHTPFLPKGYGCYIVSDAEKVASDVPAEMFKSGFTRFEMTPTPNGIVTLVYKSNAN